MKIIVSLGIIGILLISMSAFVLAEEGDSDTSTSGTDATARELPGFPGEGRRAMMEERQEERMKTREEFRTELREEFKDTKRAEVRARFEEKIRTAEGKEASKLEFRERLAERKEIRFADRNLSVKELSDERKELVVGKINARTGLNLTVEDMGNGTLGGLLRAELSNGRFAEVKVMPNRAAAIALHRMHARCAERNCSMELKEVGNGSTSRLAYVVATEQDGSFLFFKRHIPVRAEIDAETGAVIDTHKPWWAVFIRAREATGAEIEADTAVSAEDAAATEDALADASVTASA